tara:strand:+ start:4883 stop:5767 length:885 start_codon:yes stop_codon:yes gene_type:complete
MAYKYTTGSVQHGDIYNEDDAQGNTYIDWNEDALGIVVGGTTNFVVSASTVGIGTVNPTRQLDLEGSSDAYMQFNATSAGNAYTIGASSRGFIIYDDTTGGTEGFRLVVADGDGPSTRGYVGIGDGVSISAATFPSALLHLSSSDDGAIFRADTTDGTAAMFVTGSNRVGIGTTTPASTFEVSGSQAGNYTQTAGSLTVNETNYIVDYTGGGNATVTLPNAAGIPGRVYHIISHNQAEEGTLEVTGSGGDFQGPNLEGDSDTIDIEGWTPQSITVVSTGGNWFILNDNRSQREE